MLKTQTVRLYPNSFMRHYLDDMCEYRRYLWNKALEIWNLQYKFYRQGKIKKLPNECHVRDVIMMYKRLPINAWQYKLSSHALQFTIRDLAKAWDHYLNKSQTNWGKPQFKSKNDTKRLGFKTDLAKVINGKLKLDKPQKLTDNHWSSIRVKGLAKDQHNLKIKLASIYRENGKYYAALQYECQVKLLPKIQDTVGIDVNVGHFNLATKTKLYKIDIFPKKLAKLYQQIKFYQKCLAHKRVINRHFKTKNYLTIKTKLTQIYTKAVAIQHDLMHKLTTKLVTQYQKITIEDLDVKHMLMSHVASKGLHRSMFGLFRQYLTYKTAYSQRDLLVADRSFPSTQKCSQCGYVKTGDERITLSGNVKYHTKHNEYICYQCGAILNRDDNAAINLLNY